MLAQHNCYDMVCRRGGEKEGGGSLWFSKSFPVFVSRSLSLFLSFVAVFRGCLRLLLSLSLFLVESNLVEIYVLFIKICLNLSLP